jgi:hypothetical protein
MTVEELHAYFTERGFDIHGRARGRSGACHLIASYRDNWDFGDKECRVFVAANVRASDDEWIRLKFSVSRTALASEWVRNLTGDRENFLGQAGLRRLQRLLLEDDQPGRSEEVLLHSRSRPEEFQMDDPGELRAEVSRVQLELLELLWQHRYRGVERTNKRAIEDHVCSTFTTVDSVLDSFEQRRYIVGAYGASGIKITVDGEAELERLQLQNRKTSVQTQSALPHEAQSETFDVFISHASEDKDVFVRPLAEALRNAGIKVWYDEFTLQWGASLRETIDRGLATSRYGLVPRNTDRVECRHDPFRTHRPARRTLPATHQQRCRTLGQDGPKRDDRSTGPRRSDRNSRFRELALIYRPPRTGRNPKTGETVPVPAKRVPHFTAGKELRERVESSR